VNLEQNVRWQHVVLIATALAVFVGGMIVATSLADVRNAPPWTVGAGIVAGALVVAWLTVMSLRAALASAELTELCDAGVFELPLTAPPALVRLNARLTRHFGLPQHLPRPPMPTTFGELTAAVATRADTTAEIDPGQFTAARAALAEVLTVPKESIRWSSIPAQLIPGGKQRSGCWKRLQTHCSTLPEATLNPWIENIAIYGFFAGLIAIAVPIAQRLDSDPATRINPSPGAKVIGHALGLLLFGVIIAVLMVPVYLIGRRYACRLPKEIDSMAALARRFPKAGDPAESWTPTNVTDHLRDLVAEALALQPSGVRDSTMLRA
jgi:hypothetical protein